VVEGRGDYGAAPIVLRKYLQSIGEYRDILGSPVNVKGVGNVSKPGGIERFVSAVGNRPGCRGVLVILDSDDNAVCELGPTLAARIQDSCACPVAVALADRDFEDWIVASAESLDLGFGWSDTSRGLTLIEDALYPRAYTKPVDQPRLAAKIDLDLARGRSYSFNRLLERFDSLVMGLDLN
jgi:hypothetical protein